MINLVASTLYLGYLYPYVMSTSIITCSTDTYENVKINLAEKETSYIVIYSL